MTHREAEIALNAFRKRGIEAKIEGRNLDLFSTEVKVKTSEGYFCDFQDVRIFLQPKSCTTDIAAEIRRAIKQDKESKCL